MVERMQEKGIVVDLAHSSEQVGSRSRHTHACQYSWSDTRRHAGHP